MALPEDGSIHHVTAQLRAVAREKQLQIKIHGEVSKVRTSQAGQGLEQAERARARVCVCLCITYG